MVIITEQDCLIIMYRHAKKNCPWAIINDFGNIFLNFHKLSNLKMNTVIDFQLFFFGESNGLKEIHIKNLEYGFFLYVRNVRLKIVYYKVYRKNGLNHLISICKTWHLVVL